MRETFLISENPVIILPANGSRSVELGEPWNSTCVVTGNPVPKVEWKRVDGNGNLVFTQKQYNNEEVVLLLESVSKQDLGMYLCVAVNSKGIAVAFVELGRLTKLAKFHVNYYKFEIIENSRERDLVTGSGTSSDL